LKSAIGPVLFLTATLHFVRGQTPATAPVEPETDGYIVIGANRHQEALVRAQIHAMRPVVYALRIVFAPHWKYLDNSRILRLHVPTGYASVMFTHLPSRSVFIDNNRYIGEEWLSHWIAHELRHLGTNNAREEDADRAARRFRQRLKNAGPLRDR